MKVLVLRPPRSQATVRRLQRSGALMTHNFLEPAKRTVKVTETRKAVDFAEFIRALVDVHYSHAEKITCNMDNLNIHGIDSVYKAFKPSETRCNAEKLEIHHTPIHASWLNITEIEISILSRQCLAESVTSIDEMRQKGF